MGHHAGRHALLILEHVEQILAIELVLAAQALDLRKPLKPSPLSRELIAGLRERVAFMEKDRYLAPDLWAALRFVRTELSVGDIHRGVV